MDRKCQERKTDRLGMTWSYLVYVGLYLAIKGVVDSPDFLLFGELASSDYPFILALTRTLSTLSFAGWASCSSSSFGAADSIGEVLSKEHLLSKVQQPRGGNAGGSSQKGQEEAIEAFNLELTIAECSTPLGQSCLCMECFPCRHVLHNDISLAISPRGFTWNGLGGPTVDRWFQGLCDGGMGAGIDV